MRTVALLLTSIALAATATAATDRQTKTLAWSPERRLNLDITVGRVRIEGAPRKDIEVVVQRTAPTPDALRQLAFEVDESPERVDIRLVQAEGATDPAITSEVVLRVPLEARIERVRIVEGPLTVERFSGTLGAEVRRGDIQATDVSGTLRLETGIGSIALTNARLDPQGLLRLRAFNGDVRVRMRGAPADARILALALNGRIVSDVPMTTKDTWGPRWSEATLGNGTPVMSIDVVTGTIEIRTR